MWHPSHSWLPARRQRGSTLIVVVVLIAVMLIIGLGLVARSLKSNSAMAEKQHYDASVSCADGARQLLLAQFRTFNINIADLQLDQTLGTQRLVSGHYDQFNVKSVRSLSGTGAYAQPSAQGMSNRALAVKLGGAPYVFTVVCTDTTGAGRQNEVEFFIRFGL
jgi:hypothetical protein